MSDFGKDLGLVHEAIVTGRKVGANERFWATLAHSEEIFAKTVSFVLSLVGMVFCLRPVFDRDLLKEEGWKKLEKDSLVKEGQFTPELVEFVKEGDYLTGKKFEEWAEGQEDLAGQRELEAMLREQDKIPIEWRQHYLVGPKTVWVSRDGRRYVPCLSFNGECWELFFDWLGFDFLFRFRDRVVRSRKN